MVNMCEHRILLAGVCFYCNERILPALPVTYEEGKPPPPEIPPEKHHRPPGEALCENCYTGAEEDTAS